MDTQETLTVEKLQEELSSRGFIYHEHLSVSLNLTAMNTEDYVVFIMDDMAVVFNYGEDFEDNTLKIKLEEIKTFKSLDRLLKLIDMLLFVEE